ncbi:RdRp [Xinzhou partiti-like virus 1]|uniref:RdRp n=1 Tax=Xinzhou partiti-like virus 1 TaxID=1923776 RepID=UPI0009099094|nr:RdRp [Xinzhou partiti-like virus 1]APG78353.1 RdRp [Xinzhou partiti-like virus 1]
MSTLEFVRQLPSYSLMQHGTPCDLYARGLINALYPEALPSIDEYSRGMYDIEHHYTAFYKYSRPQYLEQAIKHRLESSSLIKEARAIVESELTESFTVQAISMSHLDAVSFVGSSAAGYGYVGNKRDNYLVARGHATSNLANFRRWGSKLRLTPYKAYSRTQLALRADPKIRHVWGAPFHTILIEGTIAQPIIVNLQLYDQPIYIGKDMFKELPYTLNRLLRDNFFAYCIDISAFDSSVNQIFIDWFFDFVSKTVTFPNAFTRSAVDYCRFELKHTPVVMPDGKMYICHTGIPSGSYFTQLIDSYVNLIMLRACQLSILESVVPTYVLGDDSIFCHHNPNHLESFRVLFEEFGFKLNVRKTIVSKSSQEIVFLGHNFYGSRLTRDDFTLACLAIHTETPIVNSSQTVVRLASLLYDSGHNSFFLMNLLTAAIKRYGSPRPLHPPYVQLFMLS